MPDDDDCRTPGQLIEKLLVERGWSQRVLAVVMGIGETIVHRLVTGKKELDGPTALLLEEVFGPKEILALHRAPEVLIQLAHPPRWMPGAVAALAAIGAYQVEKLVTGAAWSRAGRMVGLGPSWVSTHALQQPAQLVEALLATSSVPPFMPVGQIGGLVALDGGLVDNPPLEKLLEAEWQGRHTLVLATRPNAPPSTALRTIVRPSSPIMIDKFSVTDAAGIRAAYELGLMDGAAFARTLGGRTRPNAGQNAAR